MISIYQIYCLANGKYYIGSTKKPKTRWNCHKNDLRKGQHHNHILQNCWNKYGEESFEFKIIKQTSGNRILEEQNTLNEYAQKHGCEKIFNIGKIVDACFTGRHHSPEHKKYISEKLSGENAPKVKLSWDLVKEIRNNYLINRLTRVELGKIYGVANSNITEIINNTHWHDPEYTPPSKETIKEIRYNNHSRSHKGKVAGEKNPHAKLNWETVRQIRKDFLDGKINQSELAKKYKVTVVCICNIINNKRWIE